MADSPRPGDSPGESLVKKEPDLPAEDPIVSRSTSGWMLVSALLMTISIAWALYDEAFGQRPWKGMQREFVARYTRYLDSIKANAGKSEAEIKESPEYQQLEAEANAAREEIEPQYKEIDAEVKLVQNQAGRDYRPFQNQRGHLTVINYNVETAEGSTQRTNIAGRPRQSAQEIVEVELPSGRRAGRKTEVSITLNSKSLRRPARRESAHLAEQARLKSRTRSSNRAHRSWRRSATTI